MSGTTRTNETDTTDHGTTHAVLAVPESTDTTTARTETEDKLWEALRASPNSTAADLSTDAGIGRSTAAKILARWANGGSVTRTSGIAEGGRRAADLWSITDPHAPSATSNIAVTEHVADRDENAATPSDTRTQTTNTDETMAEGDAPDEATADAEPDTAEPSAEDTSADGQQKTRRLPPGGLRGLVEDWLRDHPRDEFSPSAIGKTLRRSSGAVANICGSSDDQVPSEDGRAWPESEVVEVLTELESAGRTVRVDADGDGRWKAAERRRSRLPQGGLQGLVEDFLTGHPDDALSPHAIGTALGRSSGAVANALVRLTERGAAVQVSERPRRYSAAPKE